MPINFPDSPSVNDTHTVGDKTWTWDGTSWDVVTAASGDHGNLGGLSDDDHTQYLRVDGTRSADSLTVSDDFTVDTDTLHVDSTNNRVGIGTTTPVVALHIDSGSTDVFAAPQIYVAPSGHASSDRAAIQLDDIQLLTDIAGDGTEDFSIYSNNAAAHRFSIDGSGNVGIGTTSPGSPLHLFGAGNAVDQIRISSTGGTVSEYGFLGADASTNVMRYGYWTGSGFGNHHFEGNVGIGTTSPNHSLSFGSPADGTRSLALWENGTAFYGLGNDTNRLAFYASNASGTAERMVINSAGNVGIGTTSPSVPLHVNGNAQTNRLGVAGGIDGSVALTVEGGSTASGSNSNILTYASSSRRGLTIGATSTSGRVHIEFKNNNGSVGSISTSGSTTYYNTSSDYRLKENLVTVANAADRLASIPVYEFNFIADPDKTVSGFVAHELAEHIPEAVFGDKDEVDEDGNPVMQGVDQSKVVPLLTAALQEALSMISDLTARIEALESA